MTSYVPTDLYLTAVPDALAYDTAGASPHARSKALMDVVRSVRTYSSDGRLLFTGMWEGVPVKLDEKILDTADLLEVAQAKLDDYVADLGHSDVARITVNTAKQLGVYYYGRPQNEWCIGNLLLDLVAEDGSSKAWKATPDVNGKPMTVDIMLGVRFEMPS